MGRHYLLIVVFMGVMASILTNGASRTPSRSGDAIFEQKAKEFDAPAAESDSGNSTTSSALDRPVEIDRSSDGHFYADVQINGASVHMLVDTGATGVALSRDDARKAGVAVSIGMNDVIGQGADGDVRGEYVTLDRVALGQKTAEALPAIVLNSGEQSLLGQNFLSQFKSVEIQGDKMLMR